MASHCDVIVPVTPFAIIEQDNGLLPVWYKVVTQANDDLVLLRMSRNPLQTLEQNLNQNNVTNSFQRCLKCHPPRSKMLYVKQTSRPCFYQTRSAWSADQGSNENHSPAYNFEPTVTKFCVMWEEGQALPHHTKFGNCRYKIVDSRAFFSWSLIHGLRWSGLIKAEPGQQRVITSHSICGM